jgi:hypothetical protein
MCLGPEDTKKNIKECLRKCTEPAFFCGMLEDWNRYSTPNSIKMQECIKDVMQERRIIYER